MSYLQFVLIRRLKRTVAGPRIVSITDISVEYGAAIIAYITSKNSV